MHIVSQDAKFISFLTMVVYWTEVGLAIATGKIGIREICWFFQGRRLKEAEFVPTNRVQWEESGKRGQWNRLAAIRFLKVYLKSSANAFQVALFLKITNN